MAETSASMPLEIANELVRQGEVRLNAILTVALAADARANTICNTTGAAGIAVLAALATVVTSSETHGNLIWPGMVLAVGLLTSAGISAFAGAPREFLVPGGDPGSLREWAWNGDAWRTPAELLDATGQRYAEAIAKDLTVLNRGATRVWFALAIALSSIILAALTYFCESDPLFSRLL
jgi:hypothetical protein